MIFPLAYTKLKAFETCPRQGYARYISKEYPFKPTPAMDYGNKVHEAFKDRINNDTPFPSDLVWLEQFLPSHTMDTSVYEAELPLAVDRDCNPCSFYDGECFFRGKLDLFNVEGDTGYVIDWKTGKPYEDPDELNLHAMVAKASYPKVKHWRGFYVWLRNRTIGDIHVLSPAVTYRKLITRVEKLKLEDIPKKNPLCPWCSLTSCEFNPEYEK